MGAKPKKAKLKSETQKPGGDILVVGKNDTCSLAGQSVDVLVVGCGANGSGLARDLAKRGLDVLVVDKGDLGCGATGASSAMIHGGPRYMLYDVATTEHSCRDSGYIQKMAPHLLERVPFLIPVSKGDPYGPAALLLHDAYFRAYDRYAKLKNGLTHAVMDAQELRHVEPGICGDFYGAVTLDEWAIDPGRLCLLNALDAQAHGAKVSLYTKVTSLLRDASGVVVGARLLSAQGAVQVGAKCVVNCAGPWAEDLAQLAGQKARKDARLRPGKGVHLVYGQRISNFAVVAQAIDGRQIFAMPYQNETWVGTTDDDYYGDLDHLHATQDEVGYLLQAITQVLPALGKQRLIGTRVGVRNTLHAYGVPEDAASRGYRIADHSAAGAAGFFSVLGGKLASYRIQAEETADAVCRYLRVAGAACQTHAHTLPGGEKTPEVAEVAAEYGITAYQAQRLIRRHGSWAHRVLELAQESPTGLHQVDNDEPVLEAEVRYCIRNEYVVHCSDLMRRCRVAMGPRMGSSSAARVAQIFAEERGLDKAAAIEECQKLLTERWQSFAPVAQDTGWAQAEAMMHAWGQHSAA